MSNHHTYADSVTNLFISNGLARFELSGSTIEGENNVKPVMVGTLVMPITGFVNLFGQMDQIVKKMIADGVLKQEESPAVKN